MPPVDDPKKSSASEWVKYVGGMLVSIFVGVLTGYLLCVQTYGERITRVETNLAALTTQVEQLSGRVWCLSSKDGGGGGQ